MIHVQAISHKFNFKTAKIQFFLRRIKSYNLLVLNNFEEMEVILTKRFLSYFGKLLPLEYYYLGWLVFKLRPIRKPNNFQLGLNSDYI